MQSNIKEIQLLANTVRFLSIDAVESAKSGHPGMPMGAADYAALLWSDFLRFNPKDPSWLGRDRFVLSAGHGCMLLYSLLHLFAYDIPLEELRNFRQWGSKTPGHPEFGHTPGVEVTSGPLGQGFANGVGLALSEKLLAAHYDKELFGKRVFGIVSDGDLMEGVASEAASLAGHLGLDNLIYIYDDNQISIGGSTGVCFTEAVPKRFEAYGWHVQSVDGHDIEAMRSCIETAINEYSKPSLICARSVIGYGSPNKAGDAEVHGAPLGSEEALNTKRNLRWETEKAFFVPEQVRSFCEKLLQEKLKEYSSWQSAFTAWKSKNPPAFEALQAQSNRAINVALKSDLLAQLASAGKEATRSLSGKAIQIIAKHLPYFLGGSADLEPSTKTLIKNSTDVQKDSYRGRNLRFGVREHAMGAIVNGFAYTKMWIPFSATFLVFSDYMRPPMRLAAISKLQSLFLFTHDSFWVGEDGPTHQAVEHLASLRLIPGLYVFRPADGIEVAMSYWAALERKEAPSAILLTRQDVAPLKRSTNFDADEVLRGAYIVSEAQNEKPDVVICASGSEVWVAQSACELLKSAGVAARVISVPCLELFLAQPQEYRQKLLPEKTKKVSFEAGVGRGWRDLLGEASLHFGLEHYGASAPGSVLAEKYAFTPKALAEKLTNWL